METLNPNFLPSLSIKLFEWTSDTKKSIMFENNFGIGHLRGEGGWGGVGLWGGGGGGILIALR